MMIIQEPLELSDCLINEEFYSFAIIKPDAQEHLGEILQMLIKKGFQIRHLKKINFTKEQAEYLYLEHCETSYFSDLVDFITSGSCCILILEKTNCIKDLRELLGPSSYWMFKAKYNDTIRGKFGTDIRQNAMHASDSLKSFKRELKLF